MASLVGFMIAVAMTGGEPMPLPEPTAHAARAMRGQPVAADPGGGVVIERRIIIRIPVMPRSERPAPQVGEGRRAIARTCLASQVIRGVSIGERGEINFITMQNARYRATLERGCNVVAFQSGFYLDAGRDGAVCVGRDMLRARSGMICLITGLTKISGY